ncbi:MAG: galactose oxidase-like domain-containing protein [Pseudomonadota bacterium]
MADGRIFVSGGHIAGHTGITALNIFDPATEAWSVMPEMAFPRWYPTATILPDGRFIVLSGETNCNDCDVTTPEIFDPVAKSWTQLTDSQFFFSFYPHAFVLPDGRLLVSSTIESSTVSQVLDLGTGKWTPIGGPAVDGGSAVMYLPGKVLKTGKSLDPDDQVTPSTATAYVLDATQASPTWQAAAPMNAPLSYHNLTLLPDGTVLVTGGGPTTAATDTANATLNPEIWSPETQTFTALTSTMSAPRLYHFSAQLMPDGRVLVTGGGRYNDTSAPSDQFSSEFFAPPYLFKGPRPVITTAPSTLQYGQTFAVQTPDAAKIGKVSLLRYGATTHTVNMAQRYLLLTFTAGAGALTVTAPANKNIAPPGNYMLFIVDTNGIPSVSTTVHF